MGYFKKAAAMLLVCAMTGCAFTGCGSKNSSSKTESSDNGMVVATMPTGEISESDIIGVWKNCKEGNDVDSVVTFNADKTGNVTVDGQRADFTWEGGGALILVTYPDGITERCCINEDGLLASASGNDMFVFKKIS